MRTTFEAYDGTIFHDVIDCFNYEWNNKYSSIEIFDLTGVQISDFHDVADWAFIAHVHNDEQCKFIEKYLFIDEWISDELDEGDEGYYVADAGYYDFYTHDTFVSKMKECDCELEGDLIYDLEA